MTTDAATQVASNIPAALPVTASTPATPAAIREAAIQALRATAPAVAAAPVVPVVAAEPTAAELADRSLRAANTVVGKRRAAVTAATTAEERATAAESARVAAVAQLAAERTAREAAEAKAKLLADPVQAARAAVEANSVEGRLAAAEARAAALEERERARDASTQSTTAQRQLAEGRRLYIEAGLAKTGDGDAAVPDFPHLAAHLAVNPRAVVLQGEAIAREYRERTGKWPQPAELRDYQEWLYSEAAGKLAPPAAAADPILPVTAPAAKPARAATRTLAARTAAPAALPKSFNDMTPAEMREATIADFRKVGAVKR